MCRLGTGYLLRLWGGLVTRAKYDSPLWKALMAKEHGKQSKVKSRSQPKKRSTDPEIRTARKQWRCDKCGQPIGKGERYVDTQRVQHPGHYGSEGIEVGWNSWHDRRHLVCPHLQDEEDADAG